MGTMMSFLPRMPTPGDCAGSENHKDGEKIAFKRHTIMTANPADNSYGIAFSQMHALALEDIDGDGIKDIVTGKRFYAHGGGDSRGARASRSLLVPDPKGGSGCRFCSLDD